MIAAARIPRMLVIITLLTSGVSTERTTFFWSIGTVLAGFFATSQTVTSQTVSRFTNSASTGLFYGGVIQLGRQTAGAGSVLAPRSSVSLILAFTLEKAEKTVGFPCGP